MVAEYVVRRATVGDATAIASVHHRAWGESYRGIVPDDVLDARAPVEKRTLIWARYLERNAGFVAVACTTEGEVAGFLSCGVAEPHTGADCEVQAIYVLDAHKRRGIGRKLLRDGGGAMRAWLESLKPLDSALAGAKNPDVVALRGPLAGGVQALIDALKYFVATAKQDPRATYAGAVPFLMLTGHVAGGAMLARSALVAERKLGESGADADFLKAKIATARFFAEHILTQSGGLRDAIVGGASTIMAIADDKLIAV